MRYEFHINENILFTGRLTLFSFQVDAALAEAVEVVEDAEVKPTSPLSIYRVVIADVIAAAADGAVSLEASFMHSIDRSFQFITEKRKRGTKRERREGDHLRREYKFPRWIE